MKPLRKRMLDYMQLKHYSASTVKSYIHQVAAFSKYIGKSPEIASLEEVSEYLLHLANDKGMSQSFLNSAYSGIKVLLVQVLGREWRRAGYFLPVQVLSRLFRGKFLHHMRALYPQGDLAFHGQAQAFQCADAFRHLVRQLYAKEWIVYAKRPFGGPQQVIQYLGRYTHRIAIGNHRIESIGQGKVSFRYKDYRDAGATKLLTLDAVEFIRR
ncbi:MAG: transposase [Saprospiraceae bacterium]|nr:transposase [Saprospiraceae bacterium]